MTSVFSGVAPTNFGGSNGTLGTDFVCAHTGSVSAIQWFQPPAGGPAAVTVGLFNTSTQALLGTAASGALIANAWNDVTLPTAIALNPGTVYTAAANFAASQIGFTPGHLLPNALPRGYLFGVDLTGLIGRTGNPGPLAFPNFFDSGGASFGVDIQFAQTPTCPECPPCPPTTGFLINLTSPGFINVVTGVGNCVIGALDQTPAGAPCRQCLLLPTAVIPWDNCGGTNPGECCGQVALAIIEQYSSDQFPRPLNATFRKCNHRYEVVHARVSVTRCVPCIGEQAQIPECSAELAAAVILENDRVAIRQAIACCLASANLATPALVSEWSIGPSTTVGESGCCAGVETDFYVGVQSCLCPN